MRKSIIFNFGKIYKLVIVSLVGHAKEESRELMYVRVKLRGARGMVMGVEYMSY